MIEVPVLMVVLAPKEYLSDSEVDELLEEIALLDGVLTVLKRQGRVEMTDGTA